MRISKRAQLTLGGIAVVAGVATPVAVFGTASASPAAQPLADPEAIIALATPRPASDLGIQTLPGQPDQLRLVDDVSCMVEFGKSPRAFTDAEWERFTKEEAPKLEAFQTFMGSVYEKLDPSDAPSAVASGSVDAEPVAPDAGSTDLPVSVTAALGDIATSDPAVKAAKEQLDALNAQISAEVEAVMSKYSAQLQQLEDAYFKALGAVDPSLLSQMKRGTAEECGERPPLADDEATRQDLAAQNSLKERFQANDVDGALKLVKEESDAIRKLAEVELNAEAPSGATTGD